MSSKTAQSAVDLVEQGEMANGANLRDDFNWNEFVHLLLCWLISAAVIFTILIVLTMAESSENLMKDVILRLDTLSLMFSLILSAGLEQMWNNKSQLKFKIIMFLEIGMAIVGLLLYLAYSMLSIIQPENVYLQNRFIVHLLYVIFGIIVVIVGFVVRSITD